MNRFMYRLMYIFSKPPWDSGVTPPEVVEAFEKGSLPPGAALDLGCGTGTNTIYMARHGRQAIGLDFAPEAIGRAQRKAAAAGLADQTEFHVADVTRLDALNLPFIGVALDMGCFHGLNAAGRRAYADGLAAAMVPDGRFMLYTLHPHVDSGASFGVSPEQVHEAFEPCFAFLREERGTFWDRASTWFWMARRGD